MNLCKKNIPSDTFTTVDLSDVIEIRRYTRNLAGTLGFSKTNQTQITSAVSEICENVIDFAIRGHVNVKSVNFETRRGILIKVTDSGPGILDISAAVKDGYSTRNRLGLGLPGTKRFMDIFKVQSKPDDGTKVVMCKWVTDRDRFMLQSV
ncbi:ATP-binding protein [Rhodohalobacter sp. SW132]|uniref:anti-sigma regulatory factor n=1 Tax=Rhodohalobacter sp. SW132 TaxID=2293433 RepID=UPI000E2655DC|nr:anti-sigma regulatory factor [Rhodohalobacter sp. SW132]REL38548.1 ATP-binding protein [Rhodohalobacter sp. SW132]